MFNPEPIARAVAENAVGSMTEYIARCIAVSAEAGGVFGAKAGVHQVAWLAAHGHLARSFPGARLRNAYRSCGGSSKSWASSA